MSMLKTFDIDVTEDEKTLVLLGNVTEYHVLQARNSRCEDRVGVYFHAEITADATRSIGFPFHLPSPLSKTGIKTFTHKERVYLRIPYLSAACGFKWLCFIPTKSCSTTRISYYLHKFNVCARSYVEYEEARSQMTGD